MKLDSVARDEDWAGRETGEGHDVPTSSSRATESGMSIPCNVIRLTRNVGDIQGNVLSTGQWLHTRGIFSCSNLLCDANGQCGWFAFGASHFLVAASG